jgi:hypothetical protein
MTMASCMPVAAGGKFHGARAAAAQNWTRPRNDCHFLDRLQPWQRGRASTKKALSALTVQCAKARNFFSKLVVK